MRLSTRLLIALLPAVILVMLGYGGWALAQREQSVRQEASREVSAYARALALGLEDVLFAGREREVREAINRVTLEPSVYGVLVYDARGRRVFASDSVASPLAADARQLAAVMATGQTLSAERELDDKPVMSVLTPVRDAQGRIVGALEVAQPLERLEIEKARVRARYVLNTITLLVLMGLLTVLLVRRLVARPMAALSDAARAVGQGDLGYRLDESGHGEVAHLAREFNAMAAGLEAARNAARSEAEERLVLERRVRESEKLAAIGTLAAGLGHEVAAPLNVIQGRADMLLRRASSAEDRDRNLRIIHREIGRIADVMRNLLSYARRRELTVGRVRVRDVIAAAREQSAIGSATRPVHFSLEGLDDLEVLGDPDLLLHVFSNLLSNAAQAASSVDLRPEVAVRARRENDWIEIEVADSGPGVPVEHRDRVFEPFFTTKTGGTGLGLALARTLVTEQGGELVVGNRAEEGGAAFRVRLPAAPDGAHA